MRVVVLAITHRTLGNIAPVMRALQKAGDTLALIWCPNTQVLDQGPADFGFKVDLAATKLEGEKRLPAEHPFWQQVRDLLEDFKPDVVISDDMTAWPVRSVWELMQGRPARPPLVGFQHGLYQNWRSMSAHFVADAFLCFGVRHVFGFPVNQWEKVIPVGLPKLDNLKDVATAKEGFSVYFAQLHPRASIISQMAVDLAKRTRRAVKIRPHPGAPEAFGPAGTELGPNVVVSPPEDDPIDLLRRCDLFLSTHSTAVLEALLLDKPVVVMPSHGLVDFATFPYIARDFTALDCARGLRAYERNPEYFRGFVDDVCGGWRFDSTERAVNAIRAVVRSSQDAGAAGLPPGWWRDESGPLAGVAPEHPLRLAAKT